MNRPLTGLDDLITRWKTGGLAGDLAVHATFPAQPAVYEAFPDILCARTISALTAMGIAAPFDHQKIAWETLLAGRHLVIATPTASGKTLCYNVPVADELCRDPSATALYLFPTKALARDQEASVRRLLALTGIDAKAVVYDGDTPGSVRKKARREAAVIITNPDMLHQGILPHHPDWARFFAQLRFVVLDELHQYRGIFGSHVANVIRRLRRLAAFHGASPVFAACSATVKNPRELAEAVLGVPVDVIDRSGAPRGRRDFLVVNPPLVDPVMGVRASAMKSAARLSARLVSAGLTTLCFCQTRRGVELVLHYLKDRIARSGGDPERIRGYRGGYLPNLRREIEDRLRDGRLDAVVATSALELGIDVGGLDAVVLAGYPGTIAATHQRGGRAGRRGEPSVTVLVARNLPLDQFLVRHPAFLLEASPERALLHPDNLDILLSHLLCAAFELPFRHGDAYASLSPDDTTAALRFLEQQGELKATKSGFHFVSQTYPAAAISLRTARGEPVTVVEEASGTSIAQVPAHSARFELHEQAVYQHDGETFEVVTLDIAANRATVRSIAADYYTVAQDQTDIRVLSHGDSRSIPSARLCSGGVEVVEHMVGFKRIRFRTHENLGFGTIDLPPLQMETEGTWIVFDEVALSQEDRSIAAAQGMAHALRHMACLRLMCDPGDIAVHLTAVRDDSDAPEEMRQPVLVLYDTCEGGVGLAAQAFSEMPLLLSDTLALLTGCSCESGCPACTGPLVEERFNLRQAATELAALLCDDPVRGGEVTRGE